MLKEWINVRQIKGDHFRRWFASETFDLIVWYDDDKENIIGFQLCYRIGMEVERALTWHQDRGYTHSAIDDGDVRPGAPKMTPVLIPDGDLPQQTVLDLFKKENQNLESEISNLIITKLKEYDFK